MNNNSQSSNFVLIAITDVLSYNKDTFLIFFMNGILSGGQNYINSTIVNRFGVSEKISVIKEYNSHTCICMYECVLQRFFL